jgi:Adenylate and Guanylate cyclase catalytic domain
MANKSGHCSYSLAIYSSSVREEDDGTNYPQTYTIIVAVVVLLMSASFCIYDNSVQRRNIKILNAAVRSNRIVSSLFPSHVRDQLLAEPDIKETDNASMSTHMIKHSPMKWKGDILGFSDNGLNLTDRDDDQSILIQTKPPIADLFTDTTIIFADIAGFTAWSSAREPTQVFVLLETVYHAFDDVARKRRVYKVETVGDCYVAVTGLPDPRKDHAGTLLQPSSRKS